MKTMIEVQYQEKNVKNGDLDKYVKETLKEQGVKTTEVETLNIYYLPETAKVFFVAIKKDGSELKGELDVNAMPEYPEVVKKTAAKKFYSFVFGGQRFIFMEDGSRLPLWSIII